MSHRWLIFLILFVAFWFRVPDLQTIPPGLYPDEAINGNDALQVLETGQWRVFYPDNNGREGLNNNLIAVFFKIFGADIWSLRLSAALAGILGVLALYLLGREWFSRPIGWLASFFMAVSFWHVNFSRISFRAIWAPTLLTFALYFLWKGLRGRHLNDFFLSGLMIGLGLYTYLAFRVTPLLLLIIGVAYWHFLKKDFARPEYQEGRNFLTRGFVLLGLTALIVALPLGAYFWLNPENFWGRTGQLSVFASTQPWSDLMRNLMQTLGMFNFVGDYNWRHNFSGQPLLFWPIGIFFLVGLWHNFRRLFKYLRRHGHLNKIPLTTLAWFFLGLGPVILSNEGLPHALRAILVAPVVFLMAGQGAWWFFEWLKHWYQLYDKHPREAELVSVLALVFLLGALGAAEYHRYFKNWARRPETASAFNQEYVALGQEINRLPVNLKKYVVIEAKGVLVNNLPMPAQTTMFITRTYKPAGQFARHTFYFLPAEWEAQKHQLANQLDSRVFFIR